MMFIRLTIVLSILIITSCQYDSSGDYDYDDTTTTIIDDQQPEIYDFDDYGNKIAIDHTEYGDLEEQNVDNQPVQSIYVDQQQPFSCYQCDSGDDNQTDCTDSCIPEKYRVECPQQSMKNAIGCRKIIQDVHGDITIVRECAYTGGEVDGLKRSGHWKINLWYYQCNDRNYCNGQQPTSAAGSLLILVIVSIATILLHNQLLNPNRVNI